MKKRKRADVQMKFPDLLDRGNKDECERGWGEGEISYHNT